MGLRYSKRSTAPATRIGALDRNPPTVDNASRIGGKPDFGTLAGSAALGRVPRVLMLHLTRPSSSEAKVLGTLLAHLGAGIDVHLVVNQAGDRDPASHFVALSAKPGITISSLNVGLPIDPSQPPSRLRRLLGRSMHGVRFRAIVAQVRHLDIDLVYTSQQRFDCSLGRLIAQRLGIPHVVHLHYTVGPWLRKSTLRTLSSCDRIIAISEFIRRDAINAGIDSNRIVVLPNTVEVPDDTTRPPSEPHKVTIGQTGRMAPTKGFTETVEIFARVHAQCPATRLLLVGDGPDRADVEAAISHHSLEPYVQITGWREDVSTLLSQIDIFLNPSRSEPFGLAVLEAMADGIPVIAYGDAGVSEIVEHGVTGCLVNAGDLDGMTNATTRLVADHDLRRRFGAAGRDRARKVFDPVSAGTTMTQILAGEARR